MKNILYNHNIKLELETRILKLLRIPCTDKFINEAVLHRIGTITVKKKTLEYIGHILRGDRYNIVKLISKGRIKGKRLIEEVEYRGFPT